MVCKTHSTRVRFRPKPAQSRRGGELAARRGLSPKVWQVSAMMNFWRNVLLALALVWAVAGGIIYGVRQARPTAQSLTIYLEKHPLPTESGAKRAKIITRVGDMLNGLNLEDRQALQGDGVTRDFFISLTPAEQAAFLDTTLPAGFKQIMEAFNKMEPEKRKEFVNRALAEAKKRQGESPPAGLNEQLVQKMVNQGLNTFYAEASANAKLDLAPLIEQMQRNLQSLR